MAEDYNRKHRHPAEVSLEEAGDTADSAIAQLIGLSESNVAVILRRTLQTLLSAWEAKNER